MPLEGQVTLITGCSSGIGRALAIELAGRRQRVFATARKPEALRDLEGLETLALDVTDAASIARAVDEVVARAGRIDLLINNAGVNAFGPLPEVPLDEVRRIFDTNVAGLVALTQAVFPHMADRGSGRIVNVGSVVGRLATPFAGPYCATKAAVHMLSDVLRMELAPFGIDVIVVEPGRVRSSIAESSSVGIERYRGERSRFRAVFEQIRARAGASQDRPMSAESFAGIVSDAILADRPPRIVRSGGGAGLYAAMSHLPRRLLDRLMIRRFGLDALRVR
jgi:NAD(P)-dependent dehydrogenase (short-subunit alcohol dehydrogenase family)